MNYFFISSACLLVIVALIHSILGEKLIIGPVLKQPLPHIFGNDFLTKRTLRFAWHLTTVVWLGIACILIYFSRQPVTATEVIVLKIIAAVFILSCLITLMASKGRHFAWWAFLAIGILICFGI